jgi:hypothetical protein
MVTALATAFSSFAGAAEVEDSVVCAVFEQELSATNINARMVRKRTTLLLLDSIPISELLAPKDEWLSPVTCPAKVYQLALEMLALDDRFVL